MSNPFASSNDQSINLVIQTAFLGDLLLCIPLLKEIKKNYPQQKLLIICRNGFGSFLKEIAVIDDFFEIEKGNSSSYFEATVFFKKYQINNIYSPHESFRTAKLVYKLKAKRKIAFHKWWNGLIFKERVIKDLNLPDALRQLSLLTIESEILKNRILEYSKNFKSSQLGPVPGWASMSLKNINKIEKNNDKKEGKKEEKEDSSKVISIFPGSVWETKKWPIDSFIELSKELIKKNFSVKLMGSKEEKDLAIQIERQNSKVTNLVGKLNLLESYKILQNSDVVITNDSGGQHLASVAGVATVSIFGPTVVNLGYRPWNEKIEIVENNLLKCRPCGKHGHHKCPLGTHECMKSITVQQVFKSVQNLL